MNRYSEVSRQILALLETIEEGISYVQNQHIEYCYEEELIILQDMMEGIRSIENALEPMVAQIEENGIECLTASLRESVSKTITSCKQEKEISFRKEIEEGVAPKFSSWKERLEKTLNIYIML